MEIQVSPSLHSYRVHRNPYVRVHVHPHEGERAPPNVAKVQCFCTISNPHEVFCAPSHKGFGAHHGSAKLHSHNKNDGETLCDSGGGGWGRTVLQDAEQRAPDVRVHENPNKIL